MSVLHKDRAIRAQRAIDTQRALYRGELRDAASERMAGQSQVEAANRRIGQLLPGALQAGISVVEAADITGVSRPTLYRMLADARAAENVRGLIVQFESAVNAVTAELARPALPQDLANAFQRSLDEVFESLSQIYEPLVREVERLGPGASMALVELLPSLGKPEKVILMLLLIHRERLEAAARSTQLPQTRVLGWAALGLLRLLPQLRERAGAPLMD
jgi:hypothetical protein